MCVICVQVMRAAEEVLASNVVSLAITQMLAPTPDVADFVQLHFRPAVQHMLW